jgi:hypothetical protein
MITITDITVPNPINSDITKATVEAKMTVFSYCSAGTGVEGGVCVVRLVTCTSFIVEDLVDIEELSI